MILLILSAIYFIIELNKKSIGWRYGNSLRQNELVDVVKLHQLGITGERIKIGLLDSGFDISHPAFKNIKVNRRYDFTDNDTIVTDEESRALAEHGTSVLSVVGGYYEGELIGIAYDSEFYLAKAEIPHIETYKEEFLAIEGIMWLDSQGVDIITNSLKFGKFEDRDYYHPSQMDGKTALVTLTADSAVANGIVFCTSVGNTFEGEWHIVEPPGDGFNVLAIGSIDKYGKVSFFSSCGPTLDGRIKPDLVTPGESVYFANIIEGQKSFWYSHGTSLSSPIAAGIASLILSCHPNLNPKEVEKALKKSADKADYPNNRVGWGIPDAYKAVSYFGPAFSNKPMISQDENFIEIETACISSLGIIPGSVKIHYSLRDNEYEEKIMKNEEKDFYQSKIDYSNSTIINFFFTATDSTDQTTIFPHPDFGHHFSFLINKNHLQELTFDRRKKQISGTM